MNFLWQYQALAEPISTEPEVTTPDKWFSQSPEPIRPSRFQAAVFAASFFFVAVVAPAVPTVDAWQQPLSEPVPIVQSHAYITETQFIAPPVPSLDTWYRQLSEPVRVIENHNYITVGALELDDSQRPETITLDKWFQELSHPVLPRFNLYYYPSTELEITVGVALDLFNPQIKSLKQKYQLESEKQSFQIESLKQKGQIEWVQ